jgi:hypothetical protein
VGFVADDSYRCLYDYIWNTWVHPCPFGREEGLGGRRGGQMGEGALPRMGSIIICIVVSFI